MTPRTNQKEGDEISHQIFSEVPFYSFNSNLYVTIGKEDGQQGAIKIKQDQASLRCNLQFILLQAKTNPGKRIVGAPYYYNKKKKQIQFCFNNKNCDFVVVKYDKDVYDITSIEVIMDVWQVKRNSDKPIQTMKSLLKKVPKYSNNQQLVPKNPIIKNEGVEYIGNMDENNYRIRLLTVCPQKFCRYSEQVIVKHKDNAILTQSHCPIELIKFNELADQTIYNIFVDWLKSEQINRKVK